jgi:molybdenum cofactor cytidylyltransferase
VPDRPAPTEREQPRAKAAVVVLAAGASTRLGRPKQLLPYKGTTLLAHAAATALAARVGPVLVVLGNESAKMREALAGLDVETVATQDWKEGMSASIRAGVGGVEKKWPGVRAIVLMTCDQPLVPPRVLRELTESVIATTKRIAACAYGGTAAVPAAFARKLFPDLLRLTGDRGARALILTRADELRTFDCPEAAVDIDTAADAAQLDGEPTTTG